jgi:hypothetical protein
MLKKDLLAEIDKKIRNSRTKTKSLVQHVGLREFLFRWLETVISDMDKLKAKGSSGSRNQYCLTTSAENLYSSVHILDRNAKVDVRTVVDSEAEGEEERTRSLRIEGVTVTLSSGEVVGVDTADLLMRALNDQSS